MLVLGYVVSSDVVGFYNERQFSGWTVGDGRFQADCERELAASVKKIPFHKHSIIMRRAVNYSNQLRNVCCSCIAWVAI